MKRHVALAALFIICGCAQTHRQLLVQNAPATVASDDIPHATAEMAAATTRFVESLTPDQHAKAVMPFTDQTSDERHNWSFVPRARKGLTWHDMTPPQRELATAMLKTGLSRRGYEKTRQIMDLETVLRDIEGAGSRRDPELYYFSVFGNPSPDQPWGWRVEGHHVSLNFTIVDGKEAAGSPAFLGANPARVPSGPQQGLRILGPEEDLARALVTSLNVEQRKVAIISATAPREITSGNSRKLDPSKPAGIPASQLSPPQSKMLRELVAEYATRLRPELAAQDQQKIDAAGFERIFFAWAGGIESGQPHYYRIQGPTFMIEYDNTQNAANHVHSVWRDPENDFGEDLLRKHYQEHRHEHE